MKNKLTFVLPKSKEKGYTLEEVKAGHYYLWDYISKSDTPYQKPAGIYNFLESGCYACELVHQIPGVEGMQCLSCPIIWVPDELHATCIDFFNFPLSPYMIWSNVKLCVTSDLKRKRSLIAQARELAIAIRDIEWKEGPKPIELLQDPDFVKNLKTVSVGSS